MNSDDQWPWELNFLSALFQASCHVSRSMVGRPHEGGTERQAGGHRRFDETCANNGYVQAGMRQETTQCGTINSDRSLRGAINRARRQFDKRRQGAYNRNLPPSPGDQQWQQRSDCIDYTDRVRLEYMPRGVSGFTTAPRKRIDAT